MKKPALDVFTIRLICLQMLTLNLTFRCFSKKTVRLTIYRMMNTAGQREKRVAHWLI